MSDEPTDPTPLSASGDLDALAGLYALDALDGDELEHFETLLATDSELQAEVDSYRATAAALSDHVATPPSAALRERVLAEVAATRQDAPLVVARRGSEPSRASTERIERARPRSFATMLIAAALVLLAGVGGFILRNAGTTDTSQLAALLSLPDTTVVELTDPTATNAGRVVVNASTGELVIVSSSLEAVDDDRTYELWRLDETGATSAGTFRPTSGNVEFATKVAFDGASGLAITNEPAGGSDQPTTPILATAEF